MYRHIEEAHSKEVLRDDVAVAARRLDSLNRPGVRVVDPGRPTRHIIRFKKQLGKKRLNLVYNIVKLCMAEGTCLLGDERRQNRTAEIQQEFTDFVEQDDFAFRKVPFMFQGPLV